MQVTTLGTQMGLSSEQVEWYRDATSVHFGHFLIDLSPRTDDRLRFCTNSDSVPPKFYIPERLKHLRTLALNTQNFSTLQVFQSLSRKCSSHFLQSCPKEFVRFLCECIVNLLKGNLQAIKRHHVVKFQGEVWFISLKRTTWNQRRNVLLSEKRLQLKAVITPPAINHLSWYGAVCSCASFCV